MHTFVYSKKKALVNVFQYYSDIHLEHQSSMYNNEKLFWIEPISSYNLDIDTEEGTSITVKNNLILAGDIGSPNSKLYWNFLRDVSQKFDRVFLIAGNHEHYTSELNDSDRVHPFTNISVEDIPKMLSEEKLFNVFFLENQSIVVDDFIIMGCTLWSNIPLNARFSILQDISDYRLIDDFSIDKNNTLHAKSVKYLSDSLDAAISDGICTRIVITHHAPLMNGTSDPMYKGLTNHAFSTDLEDLVSKSTHWIYGHTHFNPLQPVRYNLYTNQIGYKWPLKKNNPYFLVTQHIRLSSITVC